jgi:hypothetical protein
MFTDWLVEAYYLRLFLQLSKIPHYTTLQKFTDRINIMALGKINSSFILFTGTRHIFAGIDSTGFKITHASEYYTSRAKLRRKKYAKLSIGADVLKQIVCSIKIRRAPTRHDNIEPPEQEAGLLDGALDLVRGPVFDYPSTERDSYSWVDVENWISSWELKVAATAERAADLHLELGQPAEAAEIAERTLRSVPTHPGLTEILMRSHAANGDRLAVQRVYQSHVNALEQLDLDTVAKSTADLYERLRAG